MVVVGGCTSWEYCPLIIQNLGITAAAAISRNWGNGQVYSAAAIMTRTFIIVIIRVVNEPSRSFTVPGEGRYQGKGFGAQNSPELSTQNRIQHCLLETDLIKSPEAEKHFFHRN